MLIRTLLSCLLACWVVLVHAQTVYTPKDKKFFEAQLPTIKNHLATLGLTDQHITDVNIGTDTSNEHLILYLKVAKATTWISLRKGYVQTNKDTLEQVLFRYIVAKCEIDPPTQVQIHIEGDKNYFVRAGLDPETKKFIIEEDNTPKATAPPFRVPAGKYVPYALTKETDLILLRNLIITAIKKRYKNKGTWTDKAEVKVIWNDDNIVMLKIFNLKNEILKDENYYEQLYVTILLQVASKDIKFTCIVNGKYGSGFIFAPRSSQYEDMSASQEYKDILYEYALELTNYLKDTFK